MLLALFTTAIVITQVTSEWVEISQQHYKKPMRPTHNHPLITTINESVMNKANRIYGNHSLQEVNWNKGLVSKPGGVRFENDIVSIETNHGDGRPVDGDNVAVVKGDILVVRQPNPQSNRKTDSSTRLKAPAAGNVMRVRPMGNEDTSSKRKVFDEHNIEVLNLQDYEITGEDSKKTVSQDEIDIRKHKKNGLRISTPSTTIRDEAENTRYTNKPPRTTSAPNKEKQKPKDGVNKGNAIIFKSNNMRRVEIIHGDYKATPNPLSVKDSEEIERTVHKFSHIEQTTKVHLNASTVRSAPKQHTDRNRYSSTELYEEHDFPDTRSQNEIRRVDQTTAPRRVATERVSPTKNKIHSEKTRFENIPFLNHDKNPEDIMIAELLEDSKDIKVHKVAGMGTIKRVSPTEAAKLNRRNDGPSKTLAESSVKVDTDKEVYVEDEETVDLYDRTHLKPHFESSTEEIHFSTGKFKPNKSFTTKRPDISTQIERYEKNPHKHINPSRKPPPEFVTKAEDFEDSSQFNNEFGTTENNSGKRVVSEQTQRKTTDQNKFQNYPSQPQRMDNQNTNEDPLNDPQPNAMEKLIKFLKTVTDIITRNTRRGVQGKVRYLEDLRDTILATIEERIEAAFPDDDDAGGKRRTRSTWEPRGHVEFPSSESALMTISFLTFAVFLIKLVLQVIQAYKNKTMMVVPTMVAAVGRAISERGSNN